MLLCLALFPLQAVAQTDESLSWSITVALAQIEYKDSAVREVYVPYVKPRVVPKLASTAIASASFNPWSCVSLVKSLRPDLNFVWGSPNKVMAMQVEPEPGMAILTTEGNVGHTGIVKAVSSTSITILETNYEPGVTATRSLPLDSAVIRGYR